MICVDFCQTLVSVQTSMLLRTSFKSERYWQLATHRHNVLHGLLVKKRRIAIISQKCDKETEYMTLFVVCYFRFLAALWPLFHIPNLSIC